MSFWQIGIGLKLGKSPTPKNGFSFRSLGSAACSTSLGKAARLLPKRPRPVTPEYANSVPKTWRRLRTA